MPSTLLTFFNQFPALQYTQSSHPSIALNELLEMEDVWKSVYQKKGHLIDAYRTALTLEFNGLFGTEVNDLAAWQRLCRRIGLEVPPTVKKCRQLIGRTHVNLVDLVYGEWNDQGVRIFPTVQELSEYSQEEDKIFPRHNIHAGELLQYLLRHIFNPSRDDGRGQRGSRGSGRQGGRGRRDGRGRRGRGGAATTPNE